VSDDWSIGILAGPSPLRLSAHPGAAQPVLAARDVTDVEASFVADPFMVRTGEGWAMFFEVLDADTGLGRIGVATSPDAVQWRYRSLVLTEPFHLSYPHVLEWRGQHYMVPETLAPGVVRLYRADAFPGGWRHVADLAPGPAADPTPFEHAGRWWMLTCGRPYQHDTLRLFGADELHGPWREHPASPVIEGDARLGRPAGRVARVDGRLLRFAQDCRRSYGEAVTAVEIVRLTVDEYVERMIEPAPLLGPSTGFMAEGVHHVDAHELAPGRWVACVDGRGGAA
jgi:hypothetical protein